MEGKKNGVQKYRVRVNYVDSQGRSRQIDRVAYGNAEARALEAKLIHETKEAAPAASLTVQTLYTEYMAFKKHEVRETTLNKAKDVLSIHVLPHLKDIKINKLTTPILQQWKNTISENEALSNAMRRNIYGAFRTMLNYAVKMEYIPKNPLLSIGNFKDAYAAAQKEVLHYYTADEFKRYIACARKKAVTVTDWGYYVFFSIAYYTGMRKGEINALKWADINGNIIHVTKSIVQKLKGADRETPPKNKSSYRDIQLPLPLIKILQEHKERQQQIEYFSDDFRVCGGAGCLRDSSLDKKNREFANAAGLPHIRIHDFRHSHASLLANEGINIQEIARRLGHSKIEMTWNTYAHLYPREEERAVQILNKIIENV